MKRGRSPNKNGHSPSRYFIRRSVDYENRGLTDANVEHIEVTAIKTELKRERDINLMHEKEIRELRAQVASLQ